MNKILLRHISIKKYIEIANDIEEQIVICFNS